MIREKPKVLWPPKLALLNPIASHSFPMGFVRETDPLHQTFRFEPDMSIVEIVVYRNNYYCQVLEAHYLPRVWVRPLEGRRLPEAKLGVYVNDELVQQGPISDFLPEAEPVDCLGKVLYWKMSDFVFSAVPLTDTGVPDRTRQIGLMIPNGTCVEVRLSAIDAREQVLAEIEAITALYSTVK